MSSKNDLVIRTLIVGLIAYCNNPFWFFCVSNITQAVFIRQVSAVFRANLECKVPDFMIRSLLNNFKHFCFFDVVYPIVWHSDPMRRWIRIYSSYL